MAKNIILENKKRLPHSEYEVLHLHIIDSIGNVYDVKEVTSLRAEGMEGNFCLLPHHIDYLSILRPGILTYTTISGKKGYFAISEGVLNKNNDLVQISALNAIYSDSLEEMNHLVQDALSQLVDEDKDARKAVLQLEYNIMSTLMKSARNVKKFS